jgi:hypothetical protein
MLRSVQRIVDVVGCTAPVQGVSPMGAERIGRLPAVCSPTSTASFIESRMARMRSVTPVHDGMSAEA